MEYFLDFTGNAISWGSLNEVQEGLEVFVQILFGIHCIIELVNVLINK